MWILWWQKYLFSSLLLQQNKKLEDKTAAAALSKLCSLQCGNVTCMKTFFVPSVLRFDNTVGGTQWPWMLLRYCRDLSLESLPKVQWNEIDAKVANWGLKKLKLKTKVDPCRDSADSRLSLTQTARGEAECCLVPWCTYCVKLYT